MGCGSSTPAAAAAPPPGGGGLPGLPPAPLPGVPQVKPPTNGQSRRVDSTMLKAKQEDSKKIKILLLGAGGSGKSTIFKQMRLLYGSDRSEDDLRMYGVVGRSNTVVAVRKLVTHLRNLGLEGELDRESAGAGVVLPAEGTVTRGTGGMTLRQAYDTLIGGLVETNKKGEGGKTPPPPPEADQGGKKDWIGKSPRAGVAANNDAKLLCAFHESIRVLWQSETMKQVWAKRADVNVVDAHKDFLNDVSRLAAPDYKPTIHDVLITRIRTTQVIMEKYKIDGANFEMYDVGGQRSERRKWIDCFDSVTAVIFVAALSEYDQTLAEAKRTNRMIEALELFKSVCNNRAFANTSILLFLNMKDIFAQKILHSDIAAQQPFCDYAGPTKDYDHGVLYFIQKFKDCLLDDEFNDSFIHVTCATDTNNMEFVLDSTRSIIMTDNLKRSGFMGQD